MGFKATPVSNRPDVVPAVPDIYMAHLRVKDVSKGILLVDAMTPLPENYSFALNSEYTNPFNQPMSAIGGGPIGDTFEKAVGAFGASTYNKWSSGAQWSGGSEMSIEVPFVLQAFHDPAQEVLTGMRELLKLVAPSEGLSGSLMSPGPSMAQSVVDSGYEISIRIGNFFEMKPCIITNVTEDFDTQMDKNGNPIGAVVRIEFKSFYTTTKEDLDKYFISVKNIARWNGGAQRG